ncbi:MAG: hypothetical protein ACRDN0_15215 [Trebonia sp.]
MELFVAVGALALADGEAAGLSPPVLLPLLVLAVLGSVLAGMPNADAGAHFSALGMGGSTGGAAGFFAVRFCAAGSRL